MNLQLTHKSIPDLPSEKLKTLLIRNALSWRRFVIAASYAVMFATFAFFYSFIGLLSPQHIHLHEYSLTELAKEAGGHIAFGIVAAAPLWILDFNLFFLAGGVAILLDSDHLLGALNLPVSSRPDHSIVFFVASTLFVYWLAKKRGMSKPNALKTSAVVIVALLSHLSYDVFAAVSVFHGNGYAFPLLVPLSYALIAMPYLSWIVFELIGVIVAVAASLLSMHRRRS